MTNITSCLASDAVWFNSRFHMEDFLGAAGRLLAKMPDFVPGDVTAEIQKKSEVLPPPVLVDRVERTPRPTDRPLRILWCHRWEYDKNPEPFFDALIRLDEAGCRFGLVLVGEQFRTAPPAFQAACARLKEHIVHSGYVAERDDYLSQVSKCDLVVSTAIQENFGIAVVEAILCGCQPLLPKRLAYPEVIPRAFHDECLYARDSELHGRLQQLISGHGLLGDTARVELQTQMEALFGVETGVAGLDKGLCAMVSRMNSRGRVG
jgi:glycosyltransferase involved in cell wall biosynthesis